MGNLVTKLQQLVSGNRGKFSRLRKWFEGNTDYSARAALLRDARRFSLSSDRGAVTAEYAVVLMAAVAFAGLLVVIMRSGIVQELLTSLVQQALTSVG